jgi:hypothetical protein
VTSADRFDAELGERGAVLVVDRVLRRVVKHHRDLRGVGLQVPHDQCYALSRDELARLVDPAELAVPIASLPERVVVVRGDRVQLAAGSVPALTELWRTIFHASVHRAFDELLAARGLTAAAIRERVHRIGQSEFDEIRSVLRQEHLLLPPIDATTIYIEFVALYLELSYFAPDALGRTFPAALDTSRIDAVIALDLDAGELLAKSRPPGAPETPVVDAPAIEPSLPPVAFVVPSARKAVSRARARGNHARAAILAIRAGDGDAAHRELGALVDQLARVLGGADTAGWVDALLPVAHFAAAQRSLRYGIGSRLLHDLQAACVEAEREVKVVDAIGWALSRGKRAFVRSLPATREVRIARHIHAAMTKVAACELATRDERLRLGAAVRAITARADAQLRTALRPAIVEALHAVGLEPHGVPERVAEKTLVDELLDRAVALGRLSLGDLRDAVSRNDLKLADLKASEVTGGDPLLRADDALAKSLDGVYQRGETYMRALQRVSSLFFATRVGRVLTRFALLPLLAAFAIVEGLQHMIAPVAGKLGYELELSSRTTLLGVAGFLWLLLHVRPFRDGVVLLMRYTWRGLRLVLFDLPSMLWRNRIMQWLWHTRLVRWGVRPMIPALIAALVADELGPWRWALAAGVFVVAALAMAARWVRVAEEVVEDWVVRSGRHLVHRLVPGLVKLTLELFARLLDLLERALYRVDEWLRFRSGQPTIALVLKGMFGTIWFFVAYVIRLYVNLFVEPTVNPIKHFPVVTVAAKIILPFIPAMLDGIASAATPLMGPQLGNGFAAFTVLVLPGLAGFLVWELKENWKLYQATRAKELEPLAIGHHGETVGRLLRPGFHSGTIPKLFTKLRRAAWKHDETAIAAAHEGLHHVEEVVATFADRQLASMLNEVAAFRATDVAATHVSIGSNSIKIAIECPSVGVEPVTIRIELQSGWLVASIEHGWIDRLDEPQRRIVETALTGFYKRAGVDIVREQLEDALRPMFSPAKHAAESAGTPLYDLDGDHLIVWPGRGFESEILYSLRSRRLRQSARGVAYAEQIVTLRPNQVLFNRQPVYWSVWATTWRYIERGDEPLRVISGRPLLDPIA